MSLLWDCKEIKPVSPKGNQFWKFNGRTDVEAETPMLWPPDAKHWLTGKDSDAGKDWRLDERGQERMRWLDGITDSITWVWASKLGDGQGSLAFCSLWGCKESDVTEWLNWTTNKITPRKKKFHCQWENIEWYLSSDKGQTARKAKWTDLE